RSGGARIHDAIDIMAPHGRAVVAAAPGKVEKLFFSKGGGGITAYVRSPDGRYLFYYAHLQDYAPGLKEGQLVRQGDRIGTVGSSGNANPAGPHLHFAIHRMQPGEKWYEGAAVNPYPLLVGKTPPR
ncbi:MAG: M23 family metallopeptidase, partial [Pseudomonadota bacterium]|nr:M23 family metallopeptidase [Pseudomonadota bacterium]